MKKNKGFTLVELLGVIILLGVIAVIITPNILKLEKKSEKELFEDSVNALIRGAQMYYANNDFINYPTNGIAANSEELNVKNNEDLTSGTIKLVNDEYFYADNVSNGKYCANGVRNDLSIDEGKCPETPTRCFEFDKSTGAITKFYKNKVGCEISNPTVPEKIDGVEVKHIGDNSFGTVESFYCYKTSDDYRNNIYEEIYDYHEFSNYYNCVIGKQNTSNKLVSINLPSTIETIGAYSFYGNDLRLFDFKKLKQLKAIERNAFTYNKILSVDFSENKELTKIGYDSFFNNEISTLILTGADKLEEIDDWAFEENNLRENYVIADLPNLKILGSGSFYGTNLLGISFSNLPNLETIGSYSFYGNSITSLEISNLPKLNLIDDDAFYENNLSSVILKNLPLLEKIGFNSFAEMRIKTLTLQNLPSLKYIDGFAFYRNGMTNLVFDNVPNVEYFGYYSFSENAIPEFDFSIFPNLKTIDYHTMSHQGNATKKITIDNPLLEYIGNFAFDYNYQLKEVVMGENPSLKELADGVFKWDGLDDIVIPKNVQTIGNVCYYRDNTKIKSITIYGDDPTRFNSRWNNIGMNSASSVCPVMPADSNRVNCT